jgi:hypothetical protein
VQGSAAGQAGYFAICCRSARGFNPNELVPCCAVRTLKLCQWRIKHSHKDGRSPADKKRAMGKSGLRRRHYSVQLSGCNSFGVSRGRESYAKSRNSDDWSSPSVCPRRDFAIAQNRMTDTRLIAPRCQTLVTFMRHSVSALSRFSPRARKMPAIWRPLPLSGKYDWRLGSIGLIGGPPVCVANRHERSNPLGSPAPWRHFLRRPRMGNRAKRRHTGGLKPAPSKFHQARKRSRF